jgi:hypothetical protein
MSSGSSQEKLPFEPRKKKKKPKAQISQSETQATVPVTKAEPVKVTASSMLKSKKTQTEPLPKKKKRDNPEASLSAIPEAVSKRMIKRMAVFSGVPTFLGFLSFVAFYLVVSKAEVEIPTVAVLIVSIIFFGSGFLGLSYGIFSTSWDEKELGSVWGWDEFRLNFRRTISAWRESRREAKNK